MPHFECGAFDHSATSPGAITGDLREPSVGPRSRRGRRARQGVGGDKFVGRGGKSARGSEQESEQESASEKVGPPDSVKTGGPVPLH